MCENLLGKAAQRLIADNFVSETALTIRQVDRTVRILAVGEAPLLYPLFCLESVLPVPAAHWWMQNCHHPL